MRRYQVQCLDPQGRIARSWIVDCKDIEEAHALTPRSNEEAVFICLLAGHDGRENPPSQA